MYTFTDISNNRHIDVIRQLLDFLILKGITTIILDEKSMLGQQGLGWIQRV